MTAAENMEDGRPRGEGQAPESAGGAPTPLAPVHDFRRKLTQAALLPEVQAYVRWRQDVLAARRAGRPEPEAPSRAPLSINLDLTTACNYACDHCIDFDTLNSGVSFDDARLTASLETMAARGLRSVILIGGGEPTVHPRFRETVRFLKSLRLQVAVVSNGSRNDRLLDVAGVLEGEDWLRLSLDAGTDATFQALHKPKKPVTLGEICAWVPRIKAANPLPRVGFSFIVTWRGAARGGDTEVVENLGEIPAAARLARDSGFDYVSYKPFLTRTAEGAEVIDPSVERAHEAAVLRRIRAALDQAHALATPDFQVLESTNLKLLESGTWRDWTRQPRTCHMQALRQVLSPLGLYNCPAHRGVPKARIAGRDGFADERSAAATHGATAQILDRFDASHECREVTCLYHAANWWLERAVANPAGLDGAAATPGEDLFL